MYNREKDLFVVPLIAAGINPLLSGRHFFPRIETTGVMIARKQEALHGSWLCGGDFSFLSRAN
jgi:hypothetical protein